VKQIKPNFKTLGPFGKDMGLISKEIQGFSAENQSIEAMEP
jgi:isoleucyl-tRNA synthetase